MQPSDVIIIGGGPSGSFAAIALSKFYKKVNAIVLEQHASSGTPPHCSGLISYLGMEKLGLGNFISRNEGFNRIKTAKFYSPSGNELCIDRRRSELFVLDRPKLDFLLARKVQDLGIDIKFEHFAKKLTHDKNSKTWLISGVKHRKSKFNLKSKLIISTEGHHPQLLSQVGLKPPSKEWFFPGIQYKMDNMTDIDKSSVELYFGNKIAPGFFAWIIPLDDESARVGLAIHPKNSVGTRSLLNYLIKKHPIISYKTRKASITDSWGGFVPACGPIPKTYATGFLVAGDAAGQAKATTGGGFNIGSACGFIAGKVAADAVRKNDFSASFLKKYQKLWRAAFEPNLSLMKVYRRTFSFLSDTDLEALFSIALETDLEKYMLNVSDIDLHGNDLLKYSFNPKVAIKGLKMIAPLAISLVRGFFF
ncbi:MAG: geranylgeranyl reductase family protein [Candidatus Hodarchaeales archaeon]